LSATSPPLPDSWIVGCGDIGRRLARRLIAGGGRVSGWVRSAASATELEASGIAAHTVDLDAPLDAIETSPAWLFWFAPPPASGLSDPRLARFLDALQTPPQRLIYLSTSAVYGDCGGAWIDEDAPLLPANDRGRRRLDAEQTAIAYGARSGCEVLLLRVPGIYGPGRMPQARLRAGTPLLRAEESPYTNRIHADDLAAAALVVAKSGAAGSAYNVADGAPTTLTDYFLRCAALLGLPAPAQLSLAAARAEPPASLLSFLEESKRLRTARLRALGWTPQHPDLDSGLAQLGDRL